MIIGENREAVIDNIRLAAEKGEFYSKVEPGDPVLTDEQSGSIVNNYLRNRKKRSYRVKSFSARAMGNFMTSMLNKDTEIVGLENLHGMENGVIITSNHFSPTENTVIRHFVRKCGKKRLNVVSQVTNFAMDGVIGFLMNYADTIPISDDPRYLGREFTGVLKELLENNEAVLIYPEQEMWFNYRKPRPPKRGAYHFAARLGVPVVSCFVEMTDLPEMDNDSFHKVKYTLHVLETICPDPEKSVSENSAAMCQRDYELKKAAYERIYGKKLDYAFEPGDIAGWTGGAEVS